MKVSRRRFIGMAGIVTAAGSIAACAPQGTLPFVTPAVATRTPEPPVTTGDEALARLMRGNQRFVASLAANPNQTVERREQVAGGQTPFAIIMGCADSRVPPEIVFDQGLGDLFVVRLAGNVFDDSEGLGSVEYAAEHFHCPLLMVLGHEKCGAVEATIDAVEHNTTAPGRINTIVDAIIPAVKQVQGKPGDLVDNVVRANALLVAEQFRNADPFIKQLQTAGKLKIVAAHYALTSGVVEILTA